MAKMILNENSRIDILWDEDKVYKSNIQEVNDDGLSISIPVINGEYLTLQSGKEIIAISYDKDGTVYKFNCKIKERKIEGTISLYVTDAPYNIEKIQRRDFVRVQFVKDIFYKRLNNEGINRAMMLDLSGGGARVKFNEKFELNDKTKIIINHEDEEIEIETKAVRIEKALDGDWICGLLFDEIDERIREKIINLVFKIMREQRARSR